MNTGDPQFGYFGVGLVFLAVVVFMIRSSRYRRWNSADGTILKLEPVDSTDGDTTYAPRIEFCTKEGRKMEFVSSASSTSMPKIGSKIRVIYDPEYPEGAIIDGWFSRYGLELVTLAFGVTVVGIYLYHD